MRGLIVRTATRHDTNGSLSMRRFHATLAFFAAIAIAVRQYPRRSIRSLTQPAEAILFVAYVCHDGTGAIYKQDVQ